MTAWTGQPQIVVFRVRVGFVSVALVDGHRPLQRSSLGQRTAPASRLLILARLIRRYRRSQFLTRGSAFGRSPSLGRFCWCLRCMAPKICTVLGLSASRAGVQFRVRCLIPVQCNASLLWDDTPHRASHTVVRSRRYPTQADGIVANRWLPGATPAPPERGVRGRASNHAPIGSVCRQVVLIVLAVAVDAHKT